MCTVIVIRWTSSSNIFSLNGHNSWMIEMKMKRRVPREGRIEYEGIRCYRLDCRHDASIYKQTCTNIKVLQNSLDSRSINNDIRHHLIKIVRYGAVLMKWLQCFKGLFNVFKQLFWCCRLLIIDRDYIQANNAYMEMAIGNAPWPVGVTRSGIICHHHFQLISGWHTEITL